MLKKLGLLLFGVLCAIATLSVLAAPTNENTGVASREVQLDARDKDYLRLHVDCGTPARTKMCTGEPYNLYCTAGGIAYGKKRNLECQRNCECEDDGNHVYHPPWVPFSPWTPISESGEEDIETGEA